MDVARQYSMLPTLLLAMPDPRQARGQRYSWVVLLTLIVAALVAGNDHATAMHDWMTGHARAFGRYFPGLRAGVPSVTCLRDVLARIDPDALRRLVALVGLLLEDAVLGVLPTETTAGSLRILALDGKAVRGARRHGNRVHIVRMVDARNGIILDHERVDDKTNEIPAVRTLLGRHRLDGCLVVMDAMHAQQEHARLILARGGHYVMVAKGNQPGLRDALALLFDDPPYRPEEPNHWTATTVDAGHGRLEQRTMVCSTALGPYLLWPGMEVAFQRICSRAHFVPDAVATRQDQPDADEGGLQLRATTPPTVTVAYGVTSLRPASRLPASTDTSFAAFIEAVVRHYWSIENRVHYILDTSYHEDAAQSHTGTAPTALSYLRSLALNFVRFHGPPNHAMTRHKLQNSVPLTMRFLRIPLRRPLPHTLRLLAVQKSLTT